jgi:hypothetical protein
VDKAFILPILTSKIYSIRNIRLRHFLAFGLILSFAHTLHADWKFERLSKEQGLRMFDTGMSEKDPVNGGYVYPQLSFMLARTGPKTFRWMGILKTHQPAVSVVSITTGSNINPFAKSEPLTIRPKHSEKGPTRGNETIVFFATSFAEIKKLIPVDDGVTAFHIKFLTEDGETKTHGFYYEGFSNSVELMEHIAQKDGLGNLLQ